MATFVNDTFTAATDTSLNGYVGETGATWATVGAGTWTGNLSYIYLGTNRVSHAHGGDGAQLIYASGTPTGPDYTVQASLITPATLTAGIIVGLVGRGISNTNGYLFFLAPQAGVVALYSISAGSFVQLDAPAFSFAPSTTYAVELSMVGTAIVGKIDGTTISSVTNSAHTAAGQAGLWWEADTTTAGDGSDSLQLDDFSATDVVGGGGGVGRRVAVGSNANRRVF